VGETPVKGALAVKCIRQFEPGGTAGSVETFIVATMTGTPPGPVSHEYLTEVMSSGSSAGRLPTRPVCTSPR
jgi:hypothetical protein